MKCNMNQDCNNPVTHVDKKGWLSCTDHSTNSWRPIRKLRKWELLRLLAGKTIAYEMYSKALFIHRYGE